MCVTKTFAYRHNQKKKRQELHLHESVSFAIGIIFSLTFARFLMALLLNCLHAISIRHVTNADPAAEPDRGIVASMQVLRVDCFDRCILALS